MSADGRDGFGDDAEAGGGHDDWGDDTSESTQHDQGRAPSVGERGRRVAVCVGINKYKRQPLDGCVEDSRHWAEALERHLQALGRGLDVFVQVNTSDEASKFGLPPDEVEGFLRALTAYPALRVRGLMTLAILSGEAAPVRRCFVRLRTLRDRLRDTLPAGVRVDELSMGMSGDYEIAIEEGATVVRVGQALFGARATPDSHYWPDAAGERSD